MTDRNDPVVDTEGTSEPVTTPNSDPNVLSSRIPVGEGRDEIAPTWPDTIAREVNRMLSEAVTAATAHLHEEIERLKAEVEHWQAHAQVEYAARKAAEAEIARLTQEDWQPIATGPKDRRVLVYIPNESGGWQEQIASYDDDYAGNPPRPFWRCDIEHGPESDAYARANQPTHWKPLPAPPLAALTDENAHTDACEGTCNPHVSECGARFCTLEEMHQHQRECQRKDRS